MYEQIAANKRRTRRCSIAGFVVVLAVGRCRRPARSLGYGWCGVVIAFVIAGGAGLRLVLEVRPDRPGGEPGQARPTRRSTSGCTTSSRACASPAGCPSRAIYIVDDPAPNAFATGRNPKHAAIAVTTGLLEKMNRVELEGVLAHELSHIRNYDILVSTLAVTLVGAVALLADIGIRMMWWNGGRVSRGNDRDDGNNPLAFVGLRPAAPRPDHRQADAGRGEPQPRDAGRRRRRAS